MREFLRRAWYLIRRRRFDADLREELEFHRTSIERELKESGTESTEARFAARRAIGSIALAQDDAHDVWVPRALQGLGQDIRLAFRSLRATPVVAAVAILSLALGIGANTAIFSLVNDLVLRTLPVREPEQLALVDGGASFSYPVWAAIRRRPELFDGAFAWSVPRFNLAAGGTTEFADGIWASGGFFDTLGVEPRAGRLFTDADDQRGGGAAGPVAVIGWSFWQRHFGGADDAIGRTVTVERVPFTVIGITPRDFLGPDVGRAFDVALPLSDRALIGGGSSALLDDPTSRSLSIMVRRRRGQSMQEGTAALRAVQPLIRDATAPASLRGPALANYLSSPWTLSGAGTGRSTLRLRFEQPLFTLLIIVALVLLIACANVANLLLVRATARQHELSVRLALGASRWRLARPLLVESLMLAAGGALLGLVVAQDAALLVVRQLSTSVNHIALTLPIDIRVLAFTAALMGVTTVLFGAAPAWRASREAPIGAIKQPSHQIVGHANSSITAALVIGQVALSLILVVGTGLFVRTFADLARRDFGFDRRGLLVVTVGLPPVSVTPDARLEIYEQALEAARHVPGVQSAGFSVFSPLSGISSASVVRAVDQPAVTDQSVLVHWISSGWFASYRTPLLAGRDFNASDRPGSAPVAIVNAAFARRFMGGRALVGRFIRETTSYGTGAPREVVALVDDAVYTSVRQEEAPTVYFPLAQADVQRLLLYSSISIGVRAAITSPLDLSRPIAAAIARVNPNLTLTFRPMEDLVDAALVQERLIAWLSGFFGVLAVVLAALGLYGVTAYAVARRRTEIGIRMALGSRRGAVVRLMLSRVSRLVGGGVIVGSVLSLWAAHFVAALLYGVEPRDPLTLLGAVVTLAAVAALAGSFPAWRASRIDPASVLRNE